MAWTHYHGCYDIMIQRHADGSFILHVQYPYSVIVQPYMAIMRVSYKDFVPSSASISTAATCPASDAL